LQESETKRVIFGTFAMASEALDIKTLATLVMVTPKTDIVQSVGRILRTKHSNPIIVDIIDSHDFFQNQWNKRRQYYKKCNYQIKRTDSRRYGGMKIDWKTDTAWDTVFEPKDKTKFSTGGCEGEKPKCLISLEGLGFVDRLVECEKQYPT
jgi:superfamily II DNA or RNA helicase